MYKYINGSLKFNSVLWTFRGQILFQSKRTTSGWHGSVIRNDEKKTMELVFNCRGDEQYVGSTVVAQVEDAAWEGVDYRGRPIRMELIKMYELDEETEKWRPVAIAAPVDPGRSGGTPG